MNSLRSAVQRWTNLPRRQFSPRRRRGFTLVELLVVIAIIGVLVALLLPAVQAAREAARRSQCQNNLKQIGVAFQNYHAAKGVFPPGWTEDDRPDRAARGPNLAWGFHILPYLEQAPLYQRFDLKKQSTAGTFGGVVENIDLIGSVLPSYRCPTDAEPPPTGSIAAYESYNPEIPSIAVSNYVGSGSICPPCQYGWYVPGQTDATGCPEGITGVLFRNSETGIQNITDGTGQTFLVGERYYIGGGYGPYWATLPGPTSNKTACWAVSVTGHLRSLAAPLEPMINGHGEGYSSYHPGGVLMLLCDGSVQMIREGIDIPTLARLIQIHDGQVIDNVF